MVFFCKFQRKVRTDWPAEFTAYMKKTLVWLPRRNCRLQAVANVKAIITGEISMLDAQLRSQRILLGRPVDKLNRDQLALFGYTD